MLMDYMKEAECKRIHDDHRLEPTEMGGSPKCVYVPCPIIVGAGPSGLAVAACLKEKGVPSLILERASCIASLWKLRTYDRLRLHLPKQFCELPLMPFPKNFPTYPTKEHFVSYLESYATRFDLKPVFDRTIVTAEFDQGFGVWRISTVGLKDDKIEYECKWLIVATGENAEAFIPEVDGVDEFGGPIIHTSLYRSGDLFGGKRVLVVGCGNSGMEVCLDLCNFNAQPSLVVRDSVHILPQEMLGTSTFGLSMSLLKWFPVRLVDRFLLLISHLMIGDTARYGLHRPELGPLELKSITGKTPVLDVGTLAKIKSGDIKVLPAVKRFTCGAVEFVDGRMKNFDAVILATGYRSNVPTWLKEQNLFSEKDGLPRESFPGGWKGQSGLYAIGLTKRGLNGASLDARRIAEDIVHHWKADAMKYTKAFVQVPLPQSP